MLRINAQESLFNLWDKLSHGLNKTLVYLDICFYTNTAAFRSQS